MTRRRLLLLALGLLLAVPIALPFWLLHSEAGARLVWRQVEALAGGRLVAERVGGTLARGLDVRGLAYRDEAVELDVAAIAFAVDVGLFPVSIGIEAATVETVRLSVDPATEPGGDAVDPGDLLEDLAVPVALTVSDLVITDVELAGMTTAPRRIDRFALSGRLDDAITAVLEISAPEGRAAVSGTLNLEAPHALDAELRVELIEPRPMTAEARIDGTLRSADIVAAGRAALEGYAPMSVEFDGRATPDDLDVERLALSSDDLELEASGSLEWTDGLRAGGRIEIDRAELSRIVDAWPEGFPLEGALRVDYSPGAIAIDAASFAVAGTAIEVRGDLDVDVGRSTVGGTVAWRELTWPLDEPTDGIRSPTGKLELEGSLDSWRAAGQVTLDAPGVARDRILIDAEGGRDDAELVVREARVFGGQLSGDAAVSWRGAAKWSASLEVNDMRTDQLAPTLPGRLSGRVEAAGSASPLAVDARLTDVAGVLAGRPLAANGRLLLEDGVVRARDLFVRHGGNEVTLNGSPRAPAGLAFSATVRELGDYLAGATGGVQASGRLGLDDAVPWLNLTAAAERLRFGDVEIADFRIDDLEPGAGTRSRLALAASAVSLGGREILEPRAELNVSADTQTLEVDVGYEGVRFAAHVGGALDSWSEPRAWVGELEDLEFAFTGHPPVELANPADIRLSREHVFIERLCLREPGGASVCAALGWREGGQTAISAVMTAMPLTMVNAIVDTGFDFEQRLGGEFEWQRTPGGRPTGRARITASAGLIESTDRRGVSFTTGESSLSFDIVDGRLKDGSLELPMPGTGNVTGSFGVLDVSSPLGSAVEGVVVVDLDDVGLLAALSPFIDEATGAMNGRIDIGGKVNAPELSGEITLRDGGLRYDGVGLKLSDVRLTGHLEDDGSIDIEGEFTSGRGRGRIASRRGDGIDVAISGQNLTLIDVEDVTAIADLDMGLAYADGALTIDGRLGIPRARITPARLPASRETESADAVVVNGELPDRDAGDAQTGLRILGSLEVELGNDVNVDLGIANASVTGTTLFTWSGAPVPMANGRFDIQGQIQAFGQPLTVTDGRIRYADVSAANPTIRLRAEREIFGNSQVKTAGVLVAGALERPTIEAYTVPRTTEERALTLLVTGSDFDLEQGVGAVDFGTYIAPRLYVSYGVGIFERDNVISARYDLDGGFGIRATSGQRESGVDVIYRLER